MNKKGFSLIGLLLTIAIIGILATITFVAVNPSQRLADLHSRQRQVEVKAIEDGINSYALINHGFPSEFTALSDRQPYMLIPNDGVYNTKLGCNTILGYLATTTLSSLGGYLPDIPTDPTITDVASEGSGYYLAKVDDQVRVGSCYQADDLNNGLVGYWKFDDSTYAGAVDEVRDWSEHNSSGLVVGSTLNNTASDYVLGGKSMTNTGSGDFILIDHDGSLEINDALTVMAWIYRNDTSRGVIVGHEYQWEMYVNGGALYFYFRRGASDAVPNAYVQLGSNIGLGSGQWEHVAATFEPGTVKFYLNGSLAVTRTDTGCADYGNCVPTATLYNTLSSVQIGIFWNYSAYNWNGKLDEVAVWHRVLSDDEIATVYNLQANSFLGQ